MEARNGKRMRGRCETAAFAAGAACGAWAGVQSLRMGSYCSGAWAPRSGARVAVVARRRYGPAAPVCRVRRCPRVEVSVPDSLHDVQPMQLIDGTDYDFATTKGKVVLVVNVASEDSGAEQQFSILNEFYRRYHKGGLEIIAFPSNWFGQYEPGSDEEVAERIRAFGVEFTIMSKLANFDIEANPVLEMGVRAFPGEIIWNFSGKFLFDRKGKPVARFDLLSSDEFVEQKIEQYLSA